VTVAAKSQIALRPACIRPTPLKVLDCPGLGVQVDEGPQKPQRLLPGSGADAAHTRLRGLRRQRHADRRVTNPSVTGGWPSASKLRLPVCKCGESFLNGPQGSGISVRALGDAARTY
jgi:hypothetical protein